MTNETDLIKAAEEALEIAKGNKPAARLHQSGHTYVPKAELEAAQARIAELEADCSRLNEGIEAIRQFGSDTLSGPTDSSHDTRDWQRAAVKVMTWRARLLLNGYDWDAGDEEDTPSARAALEGKG